MIIHFIMFFIISDGCDLVATCVSEKFSCEIPFSLDQCSLHVDSEPVSIVLSVSKFSLTYLFKCLFAIKCLIFTEPSRRQYPR